MLQMANMQADSYPGADLNALIETARTGVHLLDGGADDVPAPHEDGRSRDGGVRFDVMMGYVAHMLIVAA